jgi:hypothetical protein
MRALLLPLATILLGVLCCSGCGTPTAGSTNPTVRDEDLIIVDLSTSLTKEQRLSIPALVKEFVLQQAQDADVTVYPLVSDMGHSELLVPSLQPPTTGRRVDVVAWQNFVQGTWAPQLEASVKKSLDLPKPAQGRIYTSCYIASAVFASQYFSSVSNASRPRLLWVGDLIEDCPLPEFRQYRLPNKGSVNKVRSLSLGLKSLSSVEVIGAILPRDPMAGPSDVSEIMTKDYWNALAPGLGMTPKLVNIGPAGAALRPAQPTH